MSDDNRDASGVEIDWTELSADALRGLAEAFVNREGTDYGAQERSFASKVEDVLGQIHRGEALVMFDPGGESANIVPKSG